jgi:hypothetical protein
MNKFNKKLSDPLIGSKLSENMQKQKFHSLTKKINHKFGQENPIQEVEDEQIKITQDEETNNVKGFS